MLTVTTASDLIEKIMRRARLSHGEQRLIRERLERIRGIGHATPEDGPTRLTVRALRGSNWRGQVRTIYERRIPKGGYDLVHALVADGLPSALEPVAVLCALTLLRREDYDALARTTAQRRASENAHLVPVEC